MDPRLSPHDDVVVVEDERQPGERWLVPRKEFLIALLAQHPVMEWAPEQRERLARLLDRPRDVLGLDGWWTFRVDRAGDFEVIADLAASPQLHALEAAARGAHAGTC